MATAIRIVMTAPIISIPKNFHMNLIQFDHSILAIAREPIRQPEVGTIRFVKASPSWNARTDVWRDTPRRSASGAGYDEEIEYRLEHVHQHGCGCTGKTGQGL